ncbi:MAG: EutN/CcmL family microcompartment protein [Acidobacteria bacterium]|nr:EutN/CcmL family microcompartment protein [Acidobacteriota bacterium]
MQLARVIGTVVATTKDAGLAARTLLVLQPLSPRHESVGPPLVAVDSVGAGRGENVFFVRGSEAAYPFHPAVVPTDASVVGICDTWNCDTWDIDARPVEPPQGRQPSARRRSKKSTVESGT